MAILNMANTVMCTKPPDNLVDFFESSAAKYTKIRSSAKKPTPEFISGQPTGKLPGGGII